MCQERPETVTGRAAELRELLNGWDPIGVVDVSGRPEDEYDCLIPELQRRLGRGDGADQLFGFLTRQLDQHFGLDPSLQVEPTRTFVGRLSDRRVAG